MRFLCKGRKSSSGAGSQLEELYQQWEELSLLLEEG